MWKKLYVIQQHQLQNKMSVLIMVNRNYSKQEILIKDV